MRIVRSFLAVASATLAAVTVWATPAHADTKPPQPFYADSLNAALDTCPHGSTDGTLLWSTPGPLLPLAVQVTGEVIDRPTATGSVVCAPDDYSSTAIFTAYSGSVVAGTMRVTVDNGIKQFRFTLGGSNGTTSAVTKLTVQVCRSPVHTLPPSYCGKAVTYTG